MRATAAYLPQVTPWGEEITFDQVTASLRHVQLRLERTKAEHEHTERCYHSWYGPPPWNRADSACVYLRNINDMLRMCSADIGRCAKHFIREGHDA